MLLREVTTPRSHWPTVGLVALSCVLASLYAAALNALMGSQ